MVRPEIFHSGYLLVSSLLCVRRLPHEKEKCVREEPKDTTKCQHTNTQHILRVSGSDPETETNSICRGYHPSAISGLRPRGYVCRVICFFAKTTLRLQRRNNPLGKTPEPDDKALKTKNTQRRPRGLTPRLRFGHLRSDVSCKRGQSHKADLKLLWFDHQVRFPCDFTSRLLSLFGQFTEGCSESRVGRLGGRASIGYDGAVQGRRGEWADRRRGTGCRRDHS